MRSKQLSLSEIAILSSHLLKFAAYFVKHNKYISIFKKKQGYHPRIDFIALKGDNLKIPQSVLIDENTIFYRNCDVFVDTHAYNRINFVDIADVNIERGKFKVLLSTTKYTKILVTTKTTTEIFYILNTSSEKHRNIKTQLNGIYNTHQKIEDETTVNTLVFWDYDNISLSSKTSFEEDHIATQIYQALQRFEPINDLICMSAVEVPNDEVVKIKKILPTAQIRREPTGEDSVDKAINREIEKNFNSYPSHVIIISGDHYYEEAVKKLLKEKVQVFLISYPVSTNRKWLELLDENYRIVLDTKRNAPKGFFHDEPEDKSVCPTCKKKISTDRYHRHQLFHQKTVCHVCEESKANDTGLYQHTVAKHGEVVCNICKTIFEEESGALKHKKSKHSEKYCKICDRHFSSEIGLDSHNKNTKQH